MRSLTVPLALALVSSVATGRAEANEPPSVPVLDNPSDHGGATTTTPVFSWEASVDPEGDAIVYELEVRDAGGALIAAQGVDGTLTSIAVELENRATYQWRARAIDRPGAASDWSPYNTFTVSAPVDDPEVVVDGSGCGASRAPGAGGLAAVGLGLALAVRARRRRCDR